MGELGVLFNPGIRHEQEEKLAKQMLREDEGTGRKGRRRIDLDSGVVVIGADDALPLAEPESSVAETSAVNGAVVDRRTSDGTAEPDADSAARTDSAAEQEPAANGRSAPVIKPGEPHVAKYASTAVPSGKARRHTSGPIAPATPIGKSHRRGR
ncbi:MAG: DUF6191 domain-containing protein [Nakamurella sp.]